jgi:DNA polymerase-3 subunit delta'
MTSAPSLAVAFTDLVGQPQAIKLLTQAVANQRIAPAYLFTGAEGIGRRLAALCVAELLLAPAEGDGTLLRRRIRQGNHPDLLWVEPTYLHQGKRLSASEAEAAGVRRRGAPILRLEQVREVIQFLARPPLEAPRSLVVLEQAETLPEGAANALLKTLEEPGKATLILIAPSVEALLPTLVSRCQRIPFYRLQQTEMETVLGQHGYGELLEHPTLLQLAQGSPGGAIAHWQRLQACPPELIEAVTQPITSAHAALHLARQIDKALELDTQLWLIDYLQQRCWQKCPTPQHLIQIRTQLNSLEIARQHLLHYVQPRLVWEVTLLNLIVT